MVVGFFPLSLGPENNHYVGCFDRHGVGGNLGRADFGHYFLDLIGKLPLENAGRLLAFLDGVFQRRAGQRAQLHCEIALRQLRNEFPAQGAE